MSGSLVPDRTLRTESGGRTLLGGHPFRALRLSEAGAGRVRAWFAGHEGPAGASETELASRLVESGLAHPQPTPVARRCHVVIPFHGDRRELDLTLAGLRGSSPASITVVDDGNPTRTTSAEGVTVVRHERPLGPGAARNTGWRHVIERSGAGDLIVFVDAGVTVPTPNTPAEPTWLDRLAGHFADAAVIAAAPRVASLPGSTTIERYEELFSPLDLGPEPSLVGPKHRVTYVPTACLMVRSDALDDADGFDPSLRYGEDVDLVWRLSDGAQIRYDPTVTVHHEPRPSLLRFAEQRFRYASAAAPLDQRHPDASAPWRSSLIGLSGVVLFSIGRPISGILIGFAPTHLLARQLGTTATPTATAIRLLAAGHVWALRSFAESASRSWTAVAVVAMLPRASRKQSLAWVLTGWARRLQQTRSLSLLALGIVDDVAYGLGAIAGAAEQRSARSLFPSISRWG